MEISDLDFEEANMRGAKSLADRHAVSARFDAKKHAIIVELASGIFIGFPADKLEGLAGATDDQLGNIILQSNGLGLHWPDLDADIYVPALLDNIFGSKKWMAAQLGSTGGKAKSFAKASASRRNGRKGGRPKKRTDPKAA